MNPRVVEVRKIEIDFFTDLSAEKESRNGNSIVLMEFNGSLINEYEGIHEGHGWEILNKNDERLLEFADSFDMVVGKTFFMKVLDKLITFKSGGNFFVIDNVVEKRCDEKSKRYDDYTG